MDCLDHNLVTAYKELLRGLNPASKAQIAAYLSEEVSGKEDAKEEAAFYASFGAWADADDKTAEAEIAELRASRVFRNKDLNF